jgi:hypothetical protein
VAIGHGDPEADTWYMFARYFVELALEPDTVTDLLVLDPGSWLPELAEVATHHGDALLTHVGFGRDVRIERTVEITLGLPVRLGSKTIIPLGWTPSGASGVFPALDADLEVAGLGDGRTQLAISARYVPPLGALGRVLDRAILARVAEATVKDFLDGVALALITGRGAPAPAPI